MNFAHLFGQIVEFNKAAGITPDHKPGIPITPELQREKEARAHEAANNAAIAAQQEKRDELARIQEEQKTFRPFRSVTCHKCGEGISFESQVQHRKKDGTVCVRDLTRAFKAGRSPFWLLDEGGFSKADLEAVGIPIPADLL